MGSLLVVGAGPKGMAIAAKATVLREQGIPAPDIHIVERQEVGAHWSGKYGYTDGRQVLGTPPEKDVGFPYQSEVWGSRNAAVNEGMQRFSWQSFLSHRGEYDDWVDRGRPYPCHGKWASYLKWVAVRLGDGARIHRGEVRGLARRDGRWQVEVDGLPQGLEIDGVVLTGPARVRLPRQMPAHSRVFTIETFWMRFREFTQVAGTVLLVGAGENAAVAAAALAELGNLSLNVQVLSPLGVVFSRGEGYTENRVYSRPDSVGWKNLLETDRREFIRRTDRGVFSVAAQQMLAQRSSLDIVPGRLDEVIPEGEELRVVYRYGTEVRSLRAHSVVLATGADTSAALGEMLSPEARVGLPLGDELLERRIGHALEVENYFPRLHLPMLSGVTQGPGFANLSCLGNLSDRILFPYVESFF